MALMNDYWLKGWFWQGERRRGVRLMIGDGCSALPRGYLGDNMRPMGWCCWYKIAEFGELEVECDWSVTHHPTSQHFQAYHSLAVGWHVSSMYIREFPSVIICRQSLAVPIRYSGLNIHFVTVSWILHVPLMLWLSRCGQWFFNPWYNRSAAGTGKLASPADVSITRNIVEMINWNRRWSMRKFWASFVEVPIIKSHFNPKIHLIIALFVCRPQCPHFSICTYVF